MLDTAVKDGVSSLTALGEAGVIRFFAAARTLGLSTGLAGALGPSDLERAPLSGPTSWVCGAAPAREAARDG